MWLLAAVIRGLVHVRWLAFRSWLRAGRAPWRRQHATQLLAQAQAAITSDPRTALLLGDVVRRVNSNRKRWSEDEPVDEDQMATASALEHR